MTNRSIIRLFSYAVCIVAVLAAYAVIGNNNSANYKARLSVISPPPAHLVTMSFTQFE